MITFDGVTKRFSDGTVAVSELDLEVDEGEVVVLVGPSGCGKTTSLRIVNRMVEPTSGRLYVNGEDALSIAPHELRRGIGYVIQKAGLFPHRTVQENIATVPRLLKWEEQRTSDRVHELMELVGLPSYTAQRYPHQLSGGQQQRVGVARALAVDPPIMLMDEPFGAVDPIVRGHLQEEFLRLQAEVRKTIVFVTHDVDEAITMGDRIAVLNVGGVLEQFATPGELLAKPANDFVADFLGEERGLKRLSLRKVSEVTAERGPMVEDSASAAEAARVAEREDADYVIVVDGDRRLQGWASVADLGTASRLADLELQQPRLYVHAENSLRAALNAMVSSHVGVAIRLGPEGTYEGIVTHEILSKELLL